MLYLLSGKKSNDKCYQYQQDTGHQDHTDDLSEFIAHKGEKIMDIPVVTQKQNGGKIKNKHTDPVVPLWTTAGRLSAGCGSHGKGEIKYGAIAKDGNQHLPYGTCPEARWKKWVIPMGVG